MDMMQQGTGDQMESGHRILDYGTPTDDEEVTLPPHDRAKEVPDFPDTDIRDRRTIHGIVVRKILDRWLIY